VSGRRPSVGEVQRVAEFRAALRRFQARSDQAARSASLTPQRYLLLVTIKGAPDGSERATVSEVADRLYMPQTTVSDLVARAEAVGLLRRVPSEVDGRMAHLSLTAEGERRLSGCMEALENDRDELERALSSATSRMRSMGREP
jgi:DNA-binding MarR family transcriptional regulator